MATPIKKKTDKKAVKDSGKKNPAKKTTKKTSSKSTGTNKPKPTKAGQKQAGKSKPEEVPKPPRQRKGLPNIPSTPGLKIPDLPNRYILRLTWKERRAIRAKITMLQERLIALKKLSKDPTATEDDKRDVQGGVNFAQGEIQIMRLAEKEHLSSEELTKLETVLIDESFNDEVLQRLKKELRGRVTAY